MAKREIGLMGYVGEAIVEQWLWWKYPLSGYSIVSQLIPMDIPRKGGGYLDFGVINNGMVEEIYEVKSQNYILDKEFEINKGLLRIWHNSIKPPSYQSQDGEEFGGDEFTQAYLVLLVAPNKDSIQKIGEKNIPNIVLFQDIWNEFSEEFDFEDLMINVSEDAKKVLEILHEPTQGKRITSEFLALRNHVSR